MIRLLHGRALRRAAAAFLAAWTTALWSCAVEAQDAPARPQRPTVSRSPEGALRLENVTLEDALRLARGWVEAGQPVIAEQLLAQLAPAWPEDARIPFLRGLAARAQSDERTAARHFRTALDIDPDADRVRYELARSYEALEKWDQASFQYRFVLGADAPVPVRADVTRRLLAISDRRRWTASFDVALAPSSNINTAPADAEIDPIFGGDNPAVLDGDSTAQTGVGARVSGGVVRQLRLAAFDGQRRRVRAQAGVSGYLTDYAQADFDDSTASAFAGLTVRRGSGALGGDMRLTRRWYAGDPYEDAWSVRLFADRSIASPLSLHLEASAGERDNLSRDDYDGGYYRAAAGLRLSLTGSSFLSADLGVSRFDTDARTTSYWDGEMTLAGYKDFRGGWSLQVAPGYGRREHDGPDPFFGEVREDDRWSLSASLVRRDFEMLGFAPFLRYRYTKNNSTLKLYDFEQHAAEFGLPRVF